MPRGVDATGELCYKSSRSAHIKTIMFTTFRVGRSSSADIRFTDSGVSRRQIEITVTAARRFYVIACAGSTPTWLWQDGDWREWQQGYVEPTAWLAFGPREVRFQDLVDQLAIDRVETPAREREPVSVKPIRKVSTGEVEVVRSGA